jgi:hypothetical protein
MLDNHPAIIGTGELSFFARGWLIGDYCSCGQPLLSCSFWKEVQSEWLRRTGMTNLETYWHLQQKCERYRRLPLVLTKFVTAPGIFQQYRMSTVELYKVIQDISGACIIVDSSKNPVRALLLAGMPEIDLRLVFLVRDVRGYAWSRQKTFNKNQESGIGRTSKPLPVWQSAAQWTFINLISEWVTRRSDKFLMVRYEDLIGNTQHVFSELGDLISLNLSSLATSFVVGETFGGNHVQAGNRLRMQKDIKLRNEERWQDNMPIRKQVIPWRLAGWLMKRYGYQEASNERLG